MSGGKRRSLHHKLSGCRRGGVKTSASFYFPMASSMVEALTREILIQKDGGDRDWRVSGGESAALGPNGPSGPLWAPGCGASTATSTRSYLSFLYQWFYLPFLSYLFYLAYLSNLSYLFDSSTYPICPPCHTCPIHIHPTCPTCPLTTALGGCNERSLGPSGCSPLESFACLSSVSAQ